MSRGRPKGEAQDPRPPRRAPGLGVSNEHVYKHFRYHGWRMKVRLKQFATFLYYDFARQEREMQESPDYTPMKKRVNNENNE